MPGRPGTASPATTTWDATRSGGGAWISNQGPVLVRLVVGTGPGSGRRPPDGELDRYREDTSRGGHAVCLVGYTRTHFIVRNSWGQRWGGRRLCVRVGAVL